MNTMSNTARAMRILVKLLLSWISFCLSTTMDSVLPSSPASTVAGVTTVSRSSCGRDYQDRIYYMFCGLQHTCYAIKANFLHMCTYLAFSLPCGSKKVICHLHLCSKNVVFCRSDVSLALVFFCPATFASRRGPQAKKLKKHVLGTRNNIPPSPTSGCSLSSVKANPVRRNSSREFEGKSLFRREMMQEI